MSRTSYSLDGCVIGEQADFTTESAAYTVSDFGWISSVEVVVERGVSQFKGVKGGTSGHLMNRNIQMLTKVSGTITFSPTDLKFLRYGPGNYSDDGTDYTIASQGTIDKFLSLKGNYDGTKAIKLKGLALGNMTVRASTDNLIEVTAPFVCQTIDIIAETVTYTQPSVDPLTYIDGSLTYNSNALLINDATATMDLKALPKRNFESVTDKYYISSITRTGFVCSFSGNADIQAASSEIEDFLGGTNGNVAKADFNVVMNFVDDAADTHSMTISGCLDTRFRKTLTGDVDNVKNYDFETVSLDVAATGKV